MKVEINVVTLEDNKEYYEIAKINLKDNIYLILTAKDEDKIAVRKLITSLNTGKTVMEKLDDVNELNLVVNEFLKKFQ